MRTSTTLGAATVTGNRNQVEITPVRRVIIDHGLTYRVIAKEIGVTAQAISEVVHGRTKGAMARYALVAAIRKLSKLKITPSDLWPDNHIPV